MTIHVSFFKKPKKWMAVAYCHEGLVLERVLDEDRAEACVQLASKLLSRLYKINNILDDTRGSFTAEGPVDEYLTK